VRREQSKRTRADREKGTNHEKKGRREEGQGGEYLRWTSARCRWSLQVAGSIWSPPCSPLLALG
jgi:hypothetical protein